MAEPARAGIRRMLPEDVDAAAAAVLEGGWGDRRAALQFYARHPSTVPLIAENHGQPVGTAIAIQHGAVGWVGLVFVAPALRGHGLGAELTRAALDQLQHRGCATAMLAATVLGRPIYDRLGFQQHGEYVVLEGPTRADGMTDRRIRPLRSTDLDAVCALDRAATDEDRSALIRALPDGWVVADERGVRGYALRTPWGRGPAIAEDPRDGALLLELLRGIAPGDTTSIVVPGPNEPAVEHLRARGFTVQRRLPRMALGPPPVWQPHQIWTIFSFAMG